MDNWNIGDLLQTFSYYLMRHMDLLSNQWVTLQVSISVFLALSLVTRPHWLAANEVLTYQSGTLKAKISQHSFGK